MTCIACRHNLYAYINIKFTHHFTISERQLHILKIVKAELDRAQIAYNREQARLLAAGVDPKARRQALAPLMDAYQTAEINYRNVRRVSLRDALDRMRASGIKP